jgi:hypothetical protein
LHAEAIKIRKQPSAVGRVGLLGVSQLSGGLHESLFLVGVEGVILVHTPLTRPEKRLRRSASVFSKAASFAGMAVLSVQTAPR